MLSQGHKTKGLLQPGQSDRLQAPLAPRRPSRVVVKATANCPYRELGVQASASETEIKQAYRKLVLQYHPDVCQVPNAQARFMSIQQAYELLTGKARGPDGRDGHKGDWAFHDWYWSFMQKRRWGSYKKGSAAAASQAQHAASSSADPSGPFHQQPQNQSAIRSQLAGLRHRAAIRANRQRNRPVWVGAAAEGAAEATASDVAEEQSQHHQQPQQQQPEAMASLDYDSTEMGDGCNMSSGVTDWEAAAAAHAAAAAKRRFSATESHKQQVMSQVAGLHRVAAAQDAGGMW